VIKEERYTQFTASARRSNGFFLLYRGGAIVQMVRGPAVGGEVIVKCT